MLHVHAQVPQARASRPPLPLPAPVYTQKVGPRGNLGFIAFDRLRQAIHLQLRKVHFAAGLGDLDGASSVFWDLFDTFWVQGSDVGVDSEGSFCC